MTSKAGADLRLLTEAVPDLNDIIRRPPKPAGHLLGQRIRRNKRYDVGNSLVPLPRHEAGLKNLRAALTTPIPRVPTGLYADAWQLFLDRAPLVRSMPAPTEENLIEAGIAVPSDQRHRVRRFVLAGVLQVGEPMLPGEVPAQRIACVATMTVLLHAVRDNSAENAWMDASWFTTTRGLAGRLGRVYASAGLRPAGSAPRLVVLADAEWDSVELDADRQQVSGLTAAFGFAGSFLIVTPDSYGAINDSLRGRSPNALIVINAGKRDSLPPLVDGWERAASASARHVHAETLTEMLEGLREEMAHLVGVSDTLRQLPVEAATERTSGGVAAFPVASTDRCRVDTGNRHYARDPATNLWWTKDTQGDGGTVFKTYTQDGGRLLFEADRTAGGEVIHKHKGPIGEIVDFSDLRGCSHPERHADAAHQ